VTRSALFLCLLGLFALNAGVLILTRTDGASAQVPPLPVPVPPVPGVVVPPPPGVPQQVVLRVGDTLRVEGAPMGCQVTERGGRPVMECRRDGSLAGTYGTFVTDRSVRVARFRSSGTARVIFTARHGGGWRACGQRARAARAAAGGCR
jgi:hypothetical protein